MPAKPISGPAGFIRSVKALARLRDEQARVRLQIMKCLQKVLTGAPGKKLKLPTPVKHSDSVLITSLEWFDNSVIAIAKAGPDYGLEALSNDTFFLIVDQLAEKSKHASA